MPNLTQSVRPRKRRRSRWGERLRNAPLFAICILSALCIEGFATASIYLFFTAEAEIAGFTIALAHLVAGISVSFGVLSLLLGAASAELEADPRPDQRRRAKAARRLSYALLIPPTVFCAGGISYQADVNEWRAYDGSIAMAMDQEMARNFTQASERDRAAAIYRLRKAIRPESPSFRIESWLAAAFLYGLNVLAVRIGWKPPRETEREAERRERRAARMRAEGRRREREAVRQRQERPTFWQRVSAVFAPAPPPPKTFDLRAWQSGPMRVN